MDVSHILDNLNEQQREAVTSEKEHLMVLAGAGSGKTRVLVTHSLTYLPCTDKIIVMKDGKIVEQGAAEDVLLHCEHEYSRKLVDSAPNLAIKPESIANDE